MTYFKQRRRLNLDVTHRCPLECPNCQRQTSFTNNGLVPHGRDLTIKEIKMIAKFFKDVAFCGQLSDPVHHPKFNEIMKELKDVPEVFVHNAATAKPISWYIKSWYIFVIIYPNVFSFFKSFVYITLCHMVSRVFGPLLIVFVFLILLYYQLKCLVYL